MQKIENMFGTILFKMSLLTSLFNLHAMVTEQDRASKWLCSLNLNSQRAKFWSSLAPQINWTRFMNYERCFLFPWRQEKYYLPSAEVSLNKSQVWILLKTDHFSLLRTFLLRNKSETKKSSLLLIWFNELNFFAKQKTRKIHELYLLWRFNCDLG